MFGEILKAAGVLGGLALTWWKIIPPIVLWFKKIFDKKKQAKDAYAALIAEVEVLKQFRESGILSISELNETIKIILTLQKVAFWFSDKEGKCIYASSALCRMLGRTEVDIENDSWSVWLIEGYKERVWLEWTSFLTRDKPFDMKYGYYHGLDSSVVNVHGRAFKLKSSGIVIGVLDKI